ncbi:MAG: ABC transporter permease subunit [Thermotogaceae bacterium]|nr:ABC transporter permease subunit [Thermotogaceae bacterium]
MKKRKIHVHVILILLVALILFPVVWVVMTSLRRDEAAFSPHLFSTNLTLQHYKDLLFPPKNIPAILSELSNKIALYPPYDSENQEKVRNSIEKDLEKLEKEIEKSKELVIYFNENSKKIEDYLKSNFNAYIKNLVSQIQDLIGKITPQIKELPEDELMYVAIYELINEGEKGTWYRKYFEIDQATLEEKWKQYIGELISEKERKAKEGEEVKLKTESIKTELNALSQEIIGIDEAIKALKGDLMKVHDVIKTAVNVEGDVNLDYSKQAERISNLCRKVSPYEKFKDISSVLSDISKIFEKPVKVSIESAEILKRQVAFLDSYLQDIEYQTEKFLSIYNEIKEKESNLKSLENTLSSLESGIQKLERKISEREEKLKPYLSKAFLIYLSDKLESKKSSISKLKFSKSSITKLNIYLKSIRSYYASAKSMNISYSKDLKNLIDQMSWAKSYKSFIGAAQNFPQLAKDAIEKMESELNSLKERWRELFLLSLKGAPVVPAEITNMKEYISRLYEGNISSNLGILIRSSRDLMYSFPAHDGRKVFKKIDKALYTFQQIWQRKPKHYFLRWVWNSVFVAGTVAIITTFVTALAAYPFSRMKFWGRRYGIMFLLLIQMFPAIMYMVALYGMLSFIGKIFPWLGLDSLGGLIFVYLGNIAFNMFLIKGFYDTIPSSLEESAMIDGATRFQTFWRIIVPLASPILAVVVILTFMGTFNEFVLARIILQDVKNYTYALGLWSFSVGPYETQWGLFTAAALLGMLPMVILFLSLQRFLISGLTKGSVKG